MFTGLIVCCSVVALVTCEIPVIMEPATHARAETRCQEEGRHLGLPCPPSQEEQQQLVHHMNQLNLSSIHLSLKRTRESQFRWVDGTHFTGDLSAGPEDLCVEVARNLSLMPSSCVSQHRGAICRYKEKPTRIDQHSCHYDNGNWFCVQFDFLNWYQARSRCRAFEGDIAVVNMTKDQTWLRGLLQRPTFNSVHAFYVGLHRANWSCQLMGKDPRQLSTYLPWEIDEPTSSVDADCAVLQTTTRQTGSWRAVSCDQKEAAICQPYEKLAEQRLKKFSKAGIIGGVVAIVVLLALIGLIIYFCRKRRAERNQAYVETEMQPMQPSIEAK